MDRDVAKEMPESLDDPEPAETLGVDAAVGRLLPTLERFLAFSGPDQVIADRERWLAALDHPLPSSGAGLETLLDELSEWVVPYGVRTPHPGFSGYITGRATTAGIAAGLAAQVAGHCRYFLTSFRAASGSGWSWRRLPLNWKPPRLDSPSRPGGEAGPDYDEARKRDDRRHEWDSRPTSTSRGTDDADGPLVRRLAAVTNPEDLRH